PDADAVAPLEAQRQQAGGKPVDLFLQLAIVPANLLVPHDQRITLAKTFGDTVEMHADRIADKRYPAGAVDVTRLRHLKRPAGLSEPARRSRPWPRHFGWRPRH